MSNVRLFKCHTKTETERGVDVHFTTHIEQGPGGPIAVPAKPEGQGSLNFSSLPVEAAAAWKPGKLYELSFKEVSGVTKG